MDFKRKFRDRGFTLVELLVVISIIALLLSILMPALNKTREKAKTVVDSAYIRGIMVATTTYTMNFGNNLPFSGRQYPYMGLLDYPEVLLVSQGLDPRKLHCPSDIYKPGSVAYWWKTASAYMRPMDTRDHLNKQVPKGVNPEVNYSKCWWLKMYVDYDKKTGDILNTTIKQWKMTDVSNPSRLIPFTCFDMGWGNVHAPQKRTSVTDLKHGGHMSGFLDGHTEFVPFTKITKRSPIGQVYGGPANLDWTMNGIKGFDVQ